MLSIHKHTFFNYYCSHNTGNKLLYLQVPCQASVVVISALETCLAVKFKKKKYLKISATLKGSEVWELNLKCQVSSCNYLFLKLEKKKKNHTPQQKPLPELNRQLALLSSIPAEKLISCLLHPR